MYGHYITADADRDIRKLAVPSLVSSTPFNTGGFANFGIALGNSGTVYFTTAIQVRFLQQPVSSSMNATVLSGDGVSGYRDGNSSFARFSALRGLAFDTASAVLFAIDSNRIRMIDCATGSASTVAGGATASFANGVGTTSLFASPVGIAVQWSGGLVVADSGNNLIRKVSCTPCSASPGYYCFTGVPIRCPAGSFCPLGSTSAIICPKGSFSAAGASNCTLCSPGTFTSATGSTSCQQCPGGHYCPTGTSSWAFLNCGRGNYCPDGSGAPTPCPYQVPPTGVWGALQVQGSAFLVETARCLNHCFWNFT